VRETLARRGRDDYGLRRAQPPDRDQGVVVEIDAPYAIAPDRVDMEDVTRRKELGLTGEELRPGRLFSGATYMFGRSPVRKSIPQRG
jgi:hypothetical protein